MMNSKRFFYVMVAVTTILGLAILGAIYFGNSLLVKQSNKLREQKLESQVAEQQQVLLTKAKKDIEKYADLKSAAKQIVPQDKSQAEVVREISNIARISGVKLSNITFPSSTLGTKTTPSATSSETGTSGTAATPDPKKPPVTQVELVPGLSGVYAMPITIQSDANTILSYDAFIRFLKNLENSRRTAQVSSITLTPDRRNNNNLSFNITLNAYIKPPAEEKK